MCEKIKHRKRCVRYNIPGHAHELTFSCYRRKPFLTCERTCSYLVHAIMRASELHEFDVTAYVFMPEHVHLLIIPRPEQYSISDILQSIKQSVARRALNYLRKNDPEGLCQLATGQKHTRYRFWQDGGGYDRNVTTRDTLLTIVPYIHNNPVRRGLVKAATDWKWSSARDWAGNGCGPLPVDLQPLQG